tara:strand:+ start:5719 stop:5853 length:135 start_codon:yes stop_codon:yes gene_type:complete
MVLLFTVLTFRALPFILAEFQVYWLIFLKASVDARLIIGGTWGQ